MTINDNNILLLLIFIFYYYYFYDIFTTKRARACARTFTHFNCVKVGVTFAQSPRVHDDCRRHPNRAAASNRLIARVRRSVVAILPDACVVCVFFYFIIAFRILFVRVRHQFHNDSGIRDPIQQTYFIDLARGKHYYYYYWTSFRIITIEFCKNIHVKPFVSKKMGDYGDAEDEVKIIRIILIK